MHRNPDEFNCNKCKKNHHCDENGEWPGSIGPAGYAMFTIKGVIDSNVCLKPMVTTHTYALIRLFKHYKNGILAKKGGVLSQPNYYLEAMEILDNV